MATVVNTRDVILRVASPRYVNDVYQSQIAVINSTLADISDDTKITAAERQALRKEWDIIIAEFVNSSNQGLAYLDNLYPTVSSYYNTYTTAVQTLATYLNNGTAYTLPAVGSSPTDAPNWISNANLSSTTAQTIVAATFRANWKAVYDTKTALVNKATEEAGKVAAWDGVSARPKLYRVVSRGASDTAAPFSTNASIKWGALIDVETNTVTSANYNDSFYSIYLSKISRSTGVVTFVDRFTSVGATGALTGQALNTVLDSIDSTYVIVLNTWTDDYFFLNIRTIPSLYNALYRCGASRVVLGNPVVTLRSAYVLIGIPGSGEGNGYEACYGEYNYGSPATTAWVDSTFYIQNGQVVTSGMSKTPVTLEEYNFTGDYDSTNGSRLGYFFDNFQYSKVEDWEEVSSGTAEISIVSSATSESGGYVLRAGANNGTDRAWLFNKTLINFDPTALYRVKASIRDTAGTTFVAYVGVAGIGSDGVTYVNASGANISSSHYYCAASGVNPDSGWTTYTGYIRGYGATAGTSAVATSPNSPAYVHPNVRFIRPLMILNYNTPSTGQMEVDYFSIEKVGGEIGTPQLADEAVSTKVVSSYSSLSLYSSTTGVSARTTDVPAQTINITSSTSRIMVSFIGDVQVLLNSSAGRLVQVSCILYLKSTDGVTTYDSLNGGANTVRVIDSTSTHTFCSLGAVGSFAAVSPGSYKIYVRTNVACYLTSGASSANIVDIFLNGECTSLEVKI